MALIRSLTIHASFVSRLGIDESISRLANTLDVLRDLSKGLGLTIWSYRIALPSDLDLSRRLRLCDEICSRDVLIAAYHSDVRSAEVRDIIDVIKVCERSYISLRLNDASSVNDVVNIYSKLINSLDVDDFTRIGISIPDFIETPYFPLATAFNEGFSIALRYVDLIKEFLSGDSSRLIRFLRGVRELCGKLSSYVGMEFLGVDYSISPWASESVVDLIEYLSGVKFALPGTGSSLSKLNNVINDVIGLSGIKALGFNEVMLPVAEDDLLKTRVAEGLVTLRDLTYLTAYCLVGIDMVVLRDDLNVIKGVIKDVFTSSIIKGRTIGVRLIPVGLPEGSEVSLKRFGKVPVIKL